MLRKRPVLLSLAATVALGGALAGHALATYPGAMGRLAYAMTGPDFNVSTS